MEFGIWGHILLLTGHIASKKEKTCHRSSDDDVINLKAIIERYTFSSNLSTVACCSETWYFGSFMLLMTNNYKFLSKKVKYFYRCVCNDDVIIVPGMLHNNFLLTICHITSKKEKTSYRLSNDDVINIQISLKVHIQLYPASAMACRSKTLVLWLFHTDND